MSENNVSKLSRPELLSNNSHYVQNRMSVIQEAPLAMSRYGKSNNISNYWKQHTLTEKKNAKLVGANPVLNPVVASLGQTHKDIHKQITQRSVRGNHDPEHN